VRTLITACVLAWLVAAALPGRASPGADADSLLAEAQQAFSGLDFEGALKKLEQARALPGNLPAVLVRIFSLRAQCLISLGRGAEAERELVALLSLAPEYRLDADASPRFAEPFQKVLHSGVPPLRAGVRAPDRLAAGEPVVFSAQVFSDPADLARRLRFHYRRHGDPVFARLEVGLIRGAAVRVALPADAWPVDRKGALEWFGEILDDFNAVLLQKGSADEPMREWFVPPPVQVAPAAVAPPPPQAPAWYQRWWVWALIGGAVAAVGGTLAAVELSGGGPDARDFSVRVR
jgi:hypothetical protein